MSRFEKMDYCFVMSFKTNSIHYDSKAKISTFKYACTQLDFSFLYQKLDSCFVMSCNEIIWIHYHSKLKRPIFKCTCAQLDSNWIQLDFSFSSSNYPNLKYTSANLDFCFVIWFKTNPMYYYNSKLTFKHTCAHLNFFLISKI